MTAGANALDDELQRRLAQVTEAARRALGLPDDEVLERDEELIAALIERLAALVDDESSRELTEVHAGQLERLRRRYDARFTALGEVDRAIARLRESTAPDAILSRAPDELCTSSQLDRVVVSLIRDGLVVAEAVHFRDDGTGAAKALEALAADPPRLEHPLIEAELLRRRRATIVSDVQAHPRVHGPTARAMGWRSYVAAPIAVRGEVIGVIHADAEPSGRTLDVLDGDVLWAFAMGLAEVYETAFLRRAVRRQRTEMREFVEWLTARSIELGDASLDLVPERKAPPDPPGAHDVVPAGAGIDDRIVFDELLTRRELDVLRLLARGETNASIAAQLVISTTTVKFHVINILRKLHVGNRAEAVARYHRLMRMPLRDDGTW